MAKLETQIYDLLQKAPGHQTADEVYELCREDGISASVASVYRVLAKLADNGAIRRIPISDRPDIFDKTIGEHGHLICRVCGAATDFAIGGLAGAVLAETGTEPERIDAIAWYICDNCTAEN